MTRTPSPVSSAASSAAPGAAGPRRLASTRCSAPVWASRRASWAPRPPVPPVISTVPRGRQPLPGGRRGAGERRRRRPSSPVGRTATWSSPSIPDSTAHRPLQAAPSSTSGRSTRPPQRRGCSRAATRPRPQIRACSVRVRFSPPAATAPRVAHHSRASSPAPSRAWTSARTSETVSSSDSTPSAFAGSRAASPARSARAGTRTSSTSAPCPASARAQSAACPLPSGASSTQRPDSRGQAGRTSGCHAIRYRSRSVAACPAVGTGQYRRCWKG